MCGTGSGLCSFSALELRILNLWFLLPEYEFYIGTYIVELADGWNWLRFVFIIGLGTEDV